MELSPLPVCPSFSISSSWPYDNPQQHSCGGDMKVEDEGSETATYWDATKTPPNSAGLDYLAAVAAALESQSQASPQVDVSGRTQPCGQNLENLPNEGLDPRHAWDANNTNALMQEIEVLRQGWEHEKAQHSQTAVQLERAQEIIWQNDHTFRILHYVQGQENDNPFLDLSTITRNIITTSSNEQRRKQWQEAITAIDYKMARLRNRAREMLKSNQLHHQLATNVRHELQEYRKWLDAKQESLGQSYRAFCEIMQEGGIEPQVLYNDVAKLQHAEHTYRKAFERRKEVVRTVVEAAHLDGLSESFQATVDGLVE